jgi:hypothetical protein
MSVFEELGALLRIRLFQWMALAALLTGAGALAFQFKYCVTDYDIWWHLKVGDWIVEHLAVPHTGILSRTAAERPWVAYSWGYEVLLSRAYAAFGLIGIGLFGTLLTVAVAYATYWMLLRLSGRFWLSCIGTAVVCSAFLYQGSPRPFFFSMALFAVTLTLLLEANRTGRVQSLYWLPPIFALWTNLHIQFIYGLFPVGLLTALCVAQHMMSASGIAPRFLLAPRLPAAKLAMIFAGCVAASLIGPNFYHSYVSVIEYSKAKFTYTVIVELQPIGFRDFREYIELLITAAGFFAVGWQKKIDPFKLLLLMAASVLAFRTMRDGWFLCIAAAACIGDAFASETSQDHPETWLENAGIAGAVAVLLLLSANATNFTQRELDRAISANYPVDAINFLRRNPVPGPLYNDLTFGGFLMWYMPQYPVVIDGRNDLYGDDLDQIFFHCENADKSYLTDPYLNESGVVLLGSDLPLAKILTIDPRFQLIYRDKVATVYSRR